MFLEFLTKNHFFEEYMKLFSTRFTMGSIRIEDNQTDLTSSKRAIEIYNNMNAFLNIIKRNPEKLSPYDIVDVADDVNKNLNFLSRGFRKVNVEVRGAPFIPTDSKNIMEEIYSLFDCYYNVWDILPVYEREARFHIKFIQIHPFEDGNGRTGRIITNFNLCKNNKAPVIISSKERKRYFDYIDNNDIAGLTKFFERKSKEELEVMLDLYKNICGDDIIEHDEEEDTDNISIMNVYREIMEANKESILTNICDVKRIKSEESDPSFEMDADIKLYSYIRDKKKKESVSN